jgi:uncharacterized protein YndB with AHSA1/START domain
MTTSTDIAATTQVYRVYIRATPQAIWDAITQPEWSAKYGYGTPSEYDLRPGGAYRSVPSDAMLAAAEENGWNMPDVILDGEVIEADPPWKLVQTWRMLMEADLAAEAFGRLTWEITEGEHGVSALTVTHDLTGAPKTAMLVSGAKEAEGAGGGWSWVLSDLKTVLETGERMTKEGQA